MWKQGTKGLVLCIINSCFSVYLLHFFLTIFLGLYSATNGVWMPASGLGPKLDFSWLESVRNQAETAWVGPGKKGPCEQLGACVGVRVSLWVSAKIKLEYPESRWCALGARCVSGDVAIQGSCSTDCVLSPAARGSHLVQISMCVFKNVFSSAQPETKTRWSFCCCLCLCDCFVCLSVNCASNHVYMYVSCGV